MNAYRVEQVSHCSACGRADGFDVVAPSGVALGITFSEEAAAEQLADDLTAAYELGRASVHASERRCKHCKATADQLGPIGMWQHCPEHEGGSLTHEWPEPKE